MNTEKIDLWYVRTDEVVGGALLAACHEILTTAEREQHQRFVFEKNRHEFLVTRGLCRGVLARELGAAPRELEFRRNEYGRPELVPQTSLRFNLTNTIGLVACAVAHGREVGVDAEPLSHAARVFEVAATVFSERERHLLSRTEDAGRERHAVSLWTLKEAYMKARGMGFAIPPERFELDLDWPRAGLSFLEPLGDEPARWELTVREIEGHIVATCVERLGVPAVEVIARRADLGSLLGVSEP